MLAAPQELAYEAHLVNNRKALPERRSCERQKVKQKIKILGMVLLALVICFSMTFLAILTVTKGYKIASIKQEINTLQRENERLQLEVARLKAPERIATVATSRLGMAEPLAEQICYVPGDGNEKQKVAVQPVEKETEVEVVVAAPQSWLHALTQVLQQWLSPVRVARAGG